MWVAQRLWLAALAAVAGLGVLHLLPAAGVSGALPALVARWRTS